MASQYGFGVHWGVALRRAAFRVWCATLGVTLFDVVGLEQPGEVFEIIYQWFTENIHTF